MLCLECPNLGGAWRKSGEACRPPARPRFVGEQGAHTIRVTGTRSHSILELKAVCTSAHVGSSHGAWSIDHGEDEIASGDAKVWRGEINSRGNGTLPGPSFTAAAERGLSGRLKYPGLTYVVLADDRRHVPQWAVLLSNTAIHPIFIFAMGHNETSRSGELNSRMTSGLNHARILSPPSNTIPPNFNGQLEPALRQRESNKPYPYNSRTILKWVSRMSAPSLMDGSIWESKYNTFIFEIRHEL